MKHKHDERDDVPLINQAKDVLDREGRKQGVHPQNDIFSDQVDDRGQDVIDELAREETIVTIENE